VSELAYLADTYKLEHKSTIVTIGQDDRGCYLQFEETVFYPQGGGQPCDLGHIDVAGVKLDIRNVQFADGHVRHYVDTLNGLASGSDVLQHVDQERRLSNSRIHTLGHLISNVIEVQLAPSLLAKKGYHFPDGAYVEFEGERGELPSGLLDQLNQILNELIQQKLPVVTREVDQGELESIGVRGAIAVAPGKPLRIVTIGSFPPIPCGGTHVADIGQIQTARATKVSNKKGATRISYEIPDRLVHK